MIITPRIVHVELLQLEALDGRLLETHVAKELIRDELGRRMAGYKGEVNLNYPLSFLSPEDFLILHHIRLFDGTHYFQIDTLIITVKFILIVGFLGMESSSAVNKILSKMNLPSRGEKRWRVYSLEVLKTPNL
ncbi:nuclease-related domain-containing protein [Bacillus salacetis]|uniref:nuclease-related domain-containing protein n=1 Tax=Bacillus salacetis TaxID=2315464 RepID=UPI003BA0AAF5